MARPPTTTETLSSRAWQAALRPTDAAALAAFRFVFGALMCVSMLRFAVSGGAERAFVERTFHFKYWGFEWVRAWPEPLMLVHVLVLAVLAAMISVGLHYRFAAVAFFVGFTWMELVDVTNYLNHYHLVSLLAFACSWLPLHRVWSLDALRRPGIAVATLPAWMTWALRAQVGVVYVFAGLAKLGDDWLLAAQPLGHWLASRADTPVLGPVVALPEVAWAMSWVGFLYDTTIVGWLSWRRSRPVAYVVLVVFHGATGLLFNIGIFPFLMTLSALVFFDAAWPRRVLPSRALSALARTQGPDESPASEGRRGSPDLGPTLRRKVAATALLVYGALQLALPLRHWLYPGNVLWTEEGMRWSWRVKVRAKRGHVSYRVTDPATGRTVVVEPRRYLTAYQEEEMSGQPDLVLQLAHHVAREFARNGQPDVEVRADALVSLNGRAPAPLIHPDVDLARVRDGLRPATWIAPAPAEPAPRVGR